MWAFVNDMHLRASVCVVQPDGTGLTCSLAEHLLKEL
jgi:hypothetical protein